MSKTTHQTNYDDVPNRQKLSLDIHLNQRWEQSIQSILSRYLFLIEKIRIRIDVDLIERDLKAC
jgi:hypothetical protein